jgi:hypothetical protein
LPNWKIWSLNHRVIEESGSKEVVSICSTIKVKCDNHSFTYTIVGSNEANPAQGLISNESPIGRLFWEERRATRLRLRFRRVKWNAIFWKLAKIKI